MGREIKSARQRNVQEALVLNDLVRTGDWIYRGSEVTKAESKENWWEQTGNKMGEPGVAYTFC